MKTGMLLLSALVITCALTFVSGRKPNPGSANGIQDYECAVRAGSVGSRAGTMGLVRIPSPAASFLKMGHWARDHWHSFWGQPLARE